MTIKSEETGEGKCMGVGMLHFKTLHILKKKENLNVENKKVTPTVEWEEKEICG